MDGKIWTNAARFALTASVALTVAMPDLGRAEAPSPAAATGAATLVQQPASGGLLGYTATFAQHFEPFVDQTAHFAMPEHAVDITAIDPATEPAVQDLGTGIASFYGRQFAGRPTASGERFDPKAFTAAHRTLPFGSKVRVTNPRNGQSVVVRINDRGPFSRGRHIDLSRRAAEQIGIVSAGHGSVELELLEG
jgi:rare lipoprotein A